jgi:hypothetical protein
VEASACFARFSDAVAAVARVASPLATTACSERLGGMRNIVSGLAAVVAIAVALLAAGCGTSVPPTRSRSSASAAVSQSYCRSSRLRVVLGPLVSEATEQNTVIVEFRNVSATTCDLRGYPSIVLSDSSGSVLPFGYRHGGDQMLTSRPPGLVVLRPGEVAYAAFNKNSCVMYASRSAVGGNVTPPGSSQPLALDLRHYRILDYCPAGDPGHVVDVSPVEPTSRDVMAAF